MSARSGAEFAVLMPAGTPDYSKLSFKELKQAMASAYARLTEIAHLHGAFVGAQNMFVTVGDVTRGAQLLADQGWQGQADEAAAAAVTRNVEYYGASHLAARHTATATHRLVEATRYHHAQMQQLNQVDSGYHASLAASGHNPFVAAQEHQRRVQHNQQTHAEAVEHATALDAQGRECSQQMRSAGWPRIRSSDNNAPPPRTLPQPQPKTGPVGPGPGLPTPTPVQPRPQPVGPRTSPIPGPGRDPSGHVIDPGATNPAGLVVPAAATTPAGGFGSGGSPSVSLGSVPAGGSLAGAGSGLAAGGLAGGLARGWPGGAEREPAGSSAAFGADEPELPRGAASELGGRTAATGALAEEEAAGTRGMYPMGGAGGRRGKDDEERKLPDYLEELGDVWGAEGQFGVPPVLGEEGQ